MADQGVSDPIILVRTFSNSLEKLFLMYMTKNGKELYIYPEGRM